MIHVADKIMHIFWLVLTCYLLDDGYSDHIPTMFLLHWYLQKSRFHVDVHLKSKRTKNVKRTLVTYIAVLSAPLISSYNTLMSYVIYDKTNAQPLGTINKMITWPLLQFYCLAILFNISTKLHFHCIIKKGIDLHLQDNRL